jgi:hypothetical protein
MPLQACALKKYGCGRSPVSKISDKKDAAASLWNSEVLSVKNPVCEPIPALSQAPEQGTKGPSLVGRQDTSDVFPKHPPGTVSASKRKEDVHERTARIIESRAVACDAEALAGCATGENIKTCCMVGPSFKAGHVAKVGHGGITLFEKRTAKRVNL